MVTVLFADYRIEIGPGIALLLLLCTAMVFLALGFVFGILIGRRQRKR